MSTFIRYAMPLASLAAMALAGCTTILPTQSAPAVEEPYQSNQQHYYNDYGVVTAIEQVAAEYQGIAGSGYGLGTVVGAVIGGVAGNQVGGGSGKTAATIAGSAGGAFIGHQLEKRRQGEASYRVTMRMPNGSQQSLEMASVGDLRVGDRVRLENGVLLRY